VKLNKYILLLLLVGVGVAERPHSGLWEMKYKDSHFYTEIYFQAEMGIWIFESTTYLVGLDGEPTKRVSTSQYLSGRYHRLSGNFSSILMCKTERYLQNGIPKSFIDKNGNVFIYAFRLTSTVTASFGRLIKGDMYEAYYFVKRED
jgi:hypothetical protein